MVPDGLYHLCSAAEWERYRADGVIVAGSLEAEGFVHCSWGRQVAGTLERHFAGAVGLVALQLDVETLDPPLVEEDTAGTGQKFPHVYGPIPAGAVLAAVNLPS